MTARQLREVSLQMNNMEIKMIELENYLEEEINKNLNNEENIIALKIEK